LSDNIFHTKQFKDNLQNYEDALSAGHPLYLEPDDYTDIAEYYQLHGRFNDALEAVDTALSMFPGATQPLAFRARVAILIDHDAEEAMHYANMIADKQDLDYYYTVAEIMIADGRADDAEKYLQDKKGEIYEDDREDFCLDVATLYVDYDVYDLAELWLDECEDTDNDDYQEIKGRIAVNKGKYKEGIRIFNTLLDHDPYNNAYWNALATAQYLNNDISDSIESCDYALAIDSEDTDAILSKANALTILGNANEAVSYYNHYNRLQPMSEVGYMGIAAVMMAENKLNEALTYWQRAEKLTAPFSPNRMDIYRNMCLIYATMGNHEKAFEIADKLEQFTGKKSPDMAVLRGYLALLAAKLPEAIAYFAYADKMTSKDERNNIRFYIAFCYFDTGYMQQAHDILRQLADADNNKIYNDFWSYLVRTDYELGLQDEFLSDLKKATERNPYGLQREMSDVFPNGMAVRDFYNYAIHHPIHKKKE
jgi:tetratricopeptide (TPR) repeat protein